MTGGVDVSAAFWVNACTQAEKRAAAAERRAEKAEAERDALTTAAQELVRATRKRLTTAGYHAIELQVDALARLAFTPIEADS